MTPSLPESQRIKHAFKTQYLSAPALLVRAPGRINLLGEHLDYNGGTVLPAAIDKAIYLAISPREDTICQLFAVDFGETHVFDLQTMVKDEARAWTHYPMGVVAQLQAQSVELRGFDLAIGGDLPSGAGVSSSAAVECGLAFALQQLFPNQLTKTALVQLAQRAENEYVGTQCGIMDQFAVMFGQRDMVIQLHCQTLAHQYVPFEAAAENLALILCDSGVKHTHSVSGYNTRREECETALRFFRSFDANIQTLCDVSPTLFAEKGMALPPIVRQRVAYVLSEQQRVLAACEDLKMGDWAAFGEKMYATHRGLSQEYEVSCAELDFLVAQTLDDASVLGARMVGGGFGGCALFLVQKNAVEHFIHLQKQAYQNKFGRELRTHVVAIADGVGVME
jgi:galactokinase